MHSSEEPVEKLFRILSGLWAFPAVKLIADSLELADDTVLEAPLPVRVTVTR